jgi:cbb3-type cytochrome oxidase subunit 3
MKKLQYLFFFICLLGITPSVFGQKKRVKRSNSMHFNFNDASLDSLEEAVMSDGFAYGGLNSMNKVITLGRDNNVNQWSVNSILGVHKNNFDVYMNNFRWSQTTPKWAETDFGISKLWHMNSPFSFVSTYEHAFVNYGTDDDKYGLNNLASLQLIWTKKNTDINLRYEYDWGRNAASILEFSIGHEWDIYNVFTKDKIEITPHFIWTYLGGVTYPVRFFKSNALAPQPFQIANYELELPITWRKVGDIECELSFLYDIPKNVLEGEGSGKSVFYVTGSVVKLFRFKNKRRKMSF